MLSFSLFNSASGSRAPMSARFNSTQARSGPNASYGSATQSTVPPRSTHATYHPDGYGISEGLKRARKPYRVRNLITGSLIMGFATSVYFYSISKVKQDDFSDLAEIRAPSAAESAPITTEADHKHKV
ncbi:Cytochrome c oxidase assembly factor 3 [Pseudozyma hubeiensis]|nr:Cytochrome c oxidase assembly factor 3 [Pseudozyma hubeiensis]